MERAVAQEIDTMPPVVSARLDWLRALRSYFAVILAGNLAWEILHLPLYAIWTTQASASRRLPCSTARAAMC